MDTLIELNNCQFCGYIFRSCDIEDAVYPTTRDKKLWQCGCINCSATVYGNTEEEVIIIWNTRVTDPFLG